MTIGLIVTFALILLLAVLASVVLQAVRIERRILDQLAQRGPLTVQQLAEMGIASAERVETVLQDLVCGGVAACRCGRTVHDYDGTLHQCPPAPARPAPSSGERERMEAARWREFVRLYEGTEAAAGAAINWVRNTILATPAPSPDAREVLREVLREALERASEKFRTVALLIRSDHCATPDEKTAAVCDREAACIDASLILAAALNGGTAE